MTPAPVAGTLAAPVNESEGDVWALWAFIGASMALGLREFIEWRMRVAEKRHNCIHDFRTRSEFGGYETLHCDKCGGQEQVRRESK
jgi:hypothetical protein